MLGGYLEAAGYVVGNKLFGVTLCRVVEMLVVVAVHKQVVAHATAHKRVLDAGQAVHLLVDIKQWRMVGIQVFAHHGMDARGLLAFGT